MSRAIASIEPVSVQAGDSIEWNKTLSQFSSHDWTLTYYLKPVQAIEGEILPGSIVATAVGGDYEIRVTAATTANWQPGKYTLVGYVSDSDERFEVYRGHIEVTPDLVTATAFDGRTYYERLLDKIRAVIEEGLIRDVIRYTWGGMQIEIMTLEDAFKAEERILSKINEENSTGKQRKIKTRFVSS